MNCDNVILFNNSSICNFSKSNQSNVVVARENAKSLDLQCSNDILLQFLEENKISIMPKVDFDGSVIDCIQSVEVVEDSSNLELKPISLISKSSLKQAVPKVQTALLENTLSRQFSSTAVF